MRFQVHSRCLHAGDGPPKAYERAAQPVLIILLLVPLYGSSFISVAILVISRLVVVAEAAFIVINICWPQALNTFLGNYRSEVPSDSTDLFLIRSMS